MSHFARSEAKTQRVNLSAMQLMRLHLLSHVNLSSGRSKHVLICYRTNKRHTFYAIELVVPLNVQVTVRVVGVGVPGGVGGDGST